MNQYIENIDYNTQPQQTIQDLLKQFQQYLQTDTELAELYNIIKSKIIYEIKMQELAVTQVMLSIEELKRQNLNKEADLLELLLAHPNYSYTDIAREMSVTKQRIHVVFKRMQSKVPWLQTYLAIKNSNYNINRTYKQGKR